VTSILAANALDDASQWVRATLSDLPYPWLFGIAAILLTLFIFGVIRKLAVVSAFVAVLAIAVLAMWFYSGKKVAEPPLPPTVVQAVNYH